MRVAVCGFHFKHAIADFEHGNVERAAAEVVHGDLLVLFLVQTVSKRRRSRLIDDAQNFEAGDFACVLRRVAL